MLAGAAASREAALMDVTGLRRVIVGCEVMCRAGDDDLSDAGVL